MDIRQMKYFESIVRNKKITKAAEELHISQPSLSAQIKVLEQELGCKLFERTAREFILTDPGIILYKHACKILLQFKKASQEMEDAKEIGTGEISLGTFPSAVYWLPQVILQLKNKYPKILIKIKEMGAESIENSLKNYDINLGITSHIIHSDILLFTPIFNEQLLLITYDNHPFNGLSQVDITDLSKESFISYQPGYQLRDIILKSCHAAGFNPQIIYECGRLETIRSLVTAGLGIALVPETYVKYTVLKDLNVIRVKNPTPKRTLYIVLHKNRYHQPAIHQFRKLIINLFERL
jgi:DNA-binding transcriptional LysR family regulator